MSVLLAKHGGVKIGHGDHLEQLTMFCKEGYLPITFGIPPYGFFEHPAEFGSIPPHRTDCGAFLLAENIGAKSLIYLKELQVIGNVQGRSIHFVSCSYQGSGII